MKEISITACVLLFAVLFSLCQADLPPIYLDRLELLPGFSIKVVSRIENARQISLNKNETWLFAGSFNAGKVYAVPITKDASGDVVQSGDTVIIGQGLNYPVGVWFDEESGNLYVSELSHVSRYENIEYVLNHGEPIPQSIIVAKFPDDMHHGWKYIKVFNDTLFVPQGSPCNICDKQPPIYGTISAMHKLTGDNNRIIARGIRNTVGFDMHPLRPTELWFSENGRDEWGDDRPGDELNVIPDWRQDPQHYGFPYCYEKDLVDPTYNPKGNCDGYVPAAYVLAPHAAALGMSFYRGAMFPRQFQGGHIALIAEHGSWNRQVPIAYRVTFVNTTDPLPSSYKTFIDGWLNLPHDTEMAHTVDLSSKKKSNLDVNDSNYAWGRPVDVLNMKDGSVLISDDKSGTVYRVTYSGQ